ncbi:MAG TPA: hypothetical protein VKP58_10315 [Candidatus Acidoferrum sp.]|nr:hypothetical protein [Candidatus Acidoferrum sp.]
MRVRPGVFCVCVLAMAGLVLCGAAKASDAQSGVWKLNLAKTTYSPGPAPKSVTLTIVADEKSYKLHSEGVDGAGNPMMGDFTAGYDGKDVPSKGLPYGDTVSVKRIDANTVEVTMKKGAKALVTVTSVVSKDGKTRTSTFVGKDEAGHDVHNVAVYEKQ